MLAAIDGRRSYHAVAAEVSERAGRDLTAEDACYLIETELRPLGVLRRPDGTDPAVRRANPLLALRFKVVVTNPKLTNRITAPFAALFRPSVVLAVTGAFLLTVWWVMFDKGLGSATHEAFQDPRLLLLVVGLTIASAGFHEFGHAAACRYGGASPGAMGAGLYLVWPAFYTEVTDSYRLGRGGRLRVDLGGLYFNAVFAVAIVAVWWTTRWDALLLVVATQVLQMVRQLTPLVRFDGYHVLADLTGVPDLFHHIKPILLSVLPSRWGRPENRVLKPWARIVVTLWVATVVPLLLTILVVIVAVLPRVASTAWEGLGVQGEVLAHNWADGDLANVGVRILSILTLAIPVLSIVYLLTRVVRRTVRRVWAATAGGRSRRAAAVAGGLVVLAGVAWAWWPSGQYQPIRPDNRGAIQDVFDVVALPVADNRDPDRDTGQGAATGAQSPAPAPSPGESTGAGQLPSGPPRLALVRVPAGTTGAGASDGATVVAPPAAAPASQDPGRGDWPFPWVPPSPPAEGDNRAMAVATRDGSAAYDVALAYVWITDGSDVAHHNEAWALASCVGCSAVAVAFQAVFVVGDTDVVTPVNLAVAASYECDRCVFHAVAVQLLTTLTAVPDQPTLAQLQQLLGQLHALEGRVRTMTLDQVHAELKTAEGRILQLLADGGYLALSTSNADVADDEGPLTADPSPTEPPGVEIGDDALDGTGEAPPAPDDQGGGDTAVQGATDGPDADTDTAATDPAAGDDETGGAAPGSDPTAEDPDDTTVGKEPEETPDPEPDADGSGGGDGDDGDPEDTPDPEPDAGGAGGGDGGDADPEEGAGGD